jgi:hypothetical protein
MSSARPSCSRHRFAADDQDGETGGRDPQGEISVDVARRIVDPLCLDDGRKQRQQSGGGERGGPITAKHGAAGHLVPDRRYVGQRPMQILHASPRTLQCKVYWDAKAMQGNFSRHREQG